MVPDAWLPHAMSYLLASVPSTRTVADGVEFPRFEILHRLLMGGQDPRSVDVLESEPPSTHLSVEILKLGGRMLIFEPGRRRMDHYRQQLWATITAPEPYDRIGVFSTLQEVTDLSGIMRPHILYMNAVAGRHFNGTLHDALGVMDKRTVAVIERRSAGTSLPPLSPPSGWKQVYSSPLMPSREGDRRSFVLPSSFTLPEAYSELVIWRRQ
ncbi:MAG: hypothetical protein HY540_01710 [Deltaproteobacteria bacterium]|nr:hypothetical protein [Deltaproteobacteria bacterium]